MGKLFTGARRLVGRKADKIARRSLTGRIVVGTGKGTARLIGVGARKSHKAIVGKYTRYKAERRFDHTYDPEPGEIPYKRFVKVAHICAPCKRKFDSADSLMDHYDQVHAGEEPAARVREQPTLTIARTGKDRGKVKVRPPRANGGANGRHRVAAHRTRADQIVDKYRVKMTEIGSKAVSEVEFVSRIHQGFLEMMTVRRGTLSQIEATALGLEQAMGVGAAAMDNWRMGLIHDGFPPECLQGIAKARQSLEEVAQNLSHTIATIHEEMGQAIADAKARQEMERRKTQGPSDEVLAG